MRKKHIDYAVFLKWVILVSAPVIAGLIIGLVSGTSIFHMDAWNTSLNDEVGYYRSVRTMRLIGTPVGANGYNEVLSKYPAFGAYNYLTYAPYALLSFFTGITSHNFMVYCNVLMMMTAYLFLVILLKPSARQTFWLILFECTELIHDRYVWSGMSETNAIFMTIVVLSCSIWLLERKEAACWKENAVFILETVCILYYGMIRPFLLAYMLFPVYYVLSRKKDLRKKAGMLLGIVFSSLGAVWLYFYMADNYCAKFFSVTGSMDLLISYLKNGSVGDCVKLVLQINKTAAETIIDSICNGTWIGILSIELVLIAVIMIIGSILHKPDSKSRDRKWTAVLFAVVSAAIYEANIILYSVNQLHRMLLASVVGGSVLCCMLFGNAECMVRQIVVIVFTAVSILSPKGRLFYALPQAADSSARLFDEKAICEKLEQIMPYDPSGDVWDMTVAAVPQEKDLFLWYCMPVYMAGNTCMEGYLKNAIDLGELKSRYVLVPEWREELRQKCGINYDLIWSGYGYEVYQQREAQTQQKIITVKNIRKEHERRQ